MSDFHDDVSSYEIATALRLVLFQFHHLCVKLEAVEECLTMSTFPLPLDVTTVVAHITMPPCSLCGCGNCLDSAAFMLMVAMVTLAYAFSFSL